MMMMMMMRRRRRRRRKGGTGSPFPHTILARTSRPASCPRPSAAGPPLSIGPLPPSLPPYLRLPKMRRRRRRKRRRPTPGGA